MDVSLTHVQGLLGSVEPPDLRLHLRWLGEATAPVGDPALGGLTLQTVALQASPRPTGSLGRRPPRAPNLVGPSGWTLFQELKGRRRALFYS